MTLITSKTSQMIAFLGAELAPKAGRLGAVLRITAFTVLVVILSETLQIPLPAYSAYIVFFISKEEATSTILTAIVCTLAITLSVFCAIGIYTLSAGETGLRFPLMAVIVFISMFISRASPLGPAAFAIGFLMTVSLTLIDGAANEDALTRSVLWLWSIVMMPIGIVIIGNLLVGRDPIDLFNQELKARIELAGRLLLTDDPPKPANQSQIVSSAQENMGALLKYLKMAGIFRKKLLRRKEANQALVAQTGRLLTLIAEWSELNTHEPHLVAAASECGTMLLSVAQTINLQEGSPFSYQKITLVFDKENVITQRKALLLLEKIIELTQSLPALLALRIQEKPLDRFQASPEQSHKQLLAPDAFSNPDYTRYALKTTLAIFIAYITYNMLDWPDIRTCMITCFVVSLSSIGETVHRMTLRIAGAVIGAGLGLATIIFIMPYLTTITDLCLMIAMVSFIAGWVATSSERLSYAGLQIALAFFFTILVGYGPTIDLALARDRVVGILLGNLIISIVFATVWPTSVVASARKMLAGALNSLSQILSTITLTPNTSQSHTDALFFAWSDALSQAEKLVFLDPFEPERVQRGTITIDTQLINAVQALYCPAIVLDNKTSMMPAITAYHQSLCAWLSQVADHIMSDTLIMLLPPQVTPVIHSLEEALIETSFHTQLLAYIAWYHTLDDRVNKINVLIHRRGHAYNASISQQERPGELPRL